MLRFSITVVVTGLAVAAACASLDAQENAASEPTPLDLFDQRILPIFRSSEPSSCVQCHLSAVDLKNYILPSSEKTFVSLRDQGLVDLQAPEKSKILTLIRMGEQDLDEPARLIHEKTRRAEYDAFAAWIEACCSDPSMRDLPMSSAAERAAPARPNEVIRHARKSRVVDSFARTVFSQRMRCFPCHTPHEIDPANPQHQAAVKTRRQFEENHGAEFMERLNIFRETPEETLDFLIAKSRETKDGELPLINLAEPRKSLLLLKPLSKLPEKDADGNLGAPSSAEPVTHLGGLKLHPDDQSYKSFVAWLEDYARVVGNEYTSVAELPADNWHATERVLRLTEAPPTWPVGMPVQLFVHALNEQSGAWTDEPIAFTQGTVTPRHFVNGALFMFGRDAGANEAQSAFDAAALSGGRYLVKVYVDSRSRLKDDPTLLLDNEDFQGQVELHQRRWREGFRNAAVVSAAQLVGE